MQDLPRHSLIQHLAELRGRLLWVLAAWAVGALVSYVFIDPLFNFLTHPLQIAAQRPGMHLIYTKLTEVFFAQFNIMIWAGFAVAIPMALWQFWRFAAPGLYAHERRDIWPFIIGAPLLFLMGSLLAYYVAMPLTWEFFLGFEQNAPDAGLPIEAQLRVQDYLDLALGFMLAFGLAFQTPLILMLGYRFGWITPADLTRYRRHAIVIIFIVAAIITPTTDVISQCILAVPLLILYELSIVWMRFSSHKNQSHNDPSFPLT